MLLYSTLELTLASLMACRYDGTVRTGAGAVVQFLYGEDGMDGTSIESQFFNNLKLTPAQMSVGHILPS